MRLHGASLYQFLFEILHLVIILLLYFILNVYGVLSAIFGVELRHSGIGEDKTDQSKDRIAYIHKNQEPAHVFLYSSWNSW